MKAPPDGLTDISEKGAVKDGVRQVLNERLFMQLSVFTGCHDPSLLIVALKASGIVSVLYEDVNDPYGIGVLAMSKDPNLFVTELRRVLSGKEFSSMRLRRGQTMFGRTYALGHEEKLEDWLLHRPRRVVANPAWPWAVWYKLRRTGAFALLTQSEQNEILMEHGVIGRAFGKADLGHDIRLSCFGLDGDDNDFVIGLIGKDLYPLSMLVQAMRRTKQTSTYIEKMGPFFIGRALWQIEPDV